MIKSYRTFLIERAVYSRLNTSYGEAPPIRQHVIVRLEDDSGNWGWGEASPLTEFTGETPQGVKLILEDKLLPMVLGKDAFDIAAIHHELEKIPGNTSAKAAIDMALFDLQGKLLGLPVCRLLGGLVRERVAVTRPIGIEPVKSAVDKACHYVDEGFKTLKIKVGSDLKEDIVRIRCIREAVGDKISIRIDGNQGFDLQTAIKLCCSVDKYNIQYFEQPLPAWDYKGLAELRKITGFKLAADESLHSLRDALRLIEHRSVDVFVIKLIKTGGLMRARQIAAVAEAAGIHCVIVTPFDTQIGASAALHFALATSNADLANEMTVFSTQPEMASTNHKVRDGFIYPDLVPGLGVSSIVELNSRST